MKSTNIKLLYDFLILTERTPVIIAYDSFVRKIGRIYLEIYFTFFPDKEEIYSENIKKDYQELSNKLSKLRDFYWIIPDFVILDEIETKLELSIKKSIVNKQFVYKFRYIITNDCYMSFRAKIYQTEWFDCQEKCFTRALEMAQLKNKRTLKEEN